MEKEEIIKELEAILKYAKESSNEFEQDYINGKLSFEGYSGFKEFYAGKEFGLKLAIDLLKA